MIIIDLPSAIFDNPPVGWRVSAYWHRYNIAGWFLSHESGITVPARKNPALYLTEDKSDDNDCAVTLDDVVDELNSLLTDNPDGNEEQNMRLHLIFDGPPGPRAGRLVEIENDAGKSINVGTWHQRPDGYWELVVDDSNEIKALRALIERVRTRPRLPPETKQAMHWHSIDEKMPPDEQFVLLRGPSGYTTTPEFVTLGRTWFSYRPTLAHGEIRWLDVTNTPLSENGWTPTHWAEWPEITDDETYDITSPTRS